MFTTWINDRYVLEQVFAYKNTVIGKKRIKTRYCEIFSDFYHTAQIPNEHKVITRTEVLDVFKSKIDCFKNASWWFCDDSIERKTRLKAKFKHLPKMWQYIPDHELGGTKPEDWVTLKEFKQTCNKNIGKELTSFILPTLETKPVSGTIYCKPFSWELIAATPNIKEKLHQCFNGVLPLVKNLIMNSSAQNAMAAYFISEQF